MTEKGRWSSPAWHVTLAVLRALLNASVLIALYYLLPMDLGGAGAGAFVKLAVGALVFVGLMTWQLREITQSDTPGLRALEGLFVAVPLFILLFATTYYVMSQSDASNFTAPLTRTDALYFTVTIFSTVGFGDITARAEATRLLVSAQMILDLVILGAGVRIILNACSAAGIGSRATPAQIPPIDLPVARPAFHVICMTTCRQACHMIVTEYMHYQSPRSHP